MPDGAFVRLIKMGELAMKKMTAFLMTLTMLFCTACSTESENLSADNISDTAEQEISVTTETEADTEPEETENTSEPAETEEAAATESLTAETKAAGEASDYEEAVRGYFECLSALDIEGILHYSYPQAYIDFLQISAETQGHTLSEMLEGFNGSGSSQIRLERIIDAEPAEAEDREEMGKLLGQYRYQLEYINTHGIEGILSGDYNIMDDSEAQNYAYSIPEAYIVECSVLEDSGDGEESDEQTLFVYYIEDEGWKIEASMISYVKKSKQAAANTYAKSIYTAAATVTVDFDIEGKTLPSSAVISSDSNKEFGTDAAFSTDFKKKMEYYFDTVQAYDYFIVMEKGNVTTVVCREPGEEKYIGRYPEPITSADKQSFDEMYESCTSDMD